MPPLKGLGNTINAYPGLTSWAKFVSPCGLSSARLRRETPTLFTTPERSLDGVLHPGCAVLVKGRDAVFRRNELRIAFVGRSFDEVEDCLGLVIFIFTRGHDSQYEYNKEGPGILMRDPKLLLNNNGAGKAEDIHLFIGKHPKAAFGNTSGDQQMLEYTQAGGGASLEMLVLHDDAIREYAYGPATGLPDTKVGAFSQALYDEAKAKGWTVISMKNDWKQIFAWEK